MVNEYIRRGVVAAGQWIEEQGEKTDYSATITMDPLG